VPVDLLEQRRCGVKIAVNVLPALLEHDNQSGDYANLLSKFDGLFGFRHVIATSWELLSRWHGAREASGADVSIQPEVGHLRASDFDAFDDLIRCGRRAAERQLEAIRGAMQAALRPGTP
jgi:hypothetical protein